jgi:hypothetical protein
LRSSGLKAAVSGALNGEMDEEAGEEKQQRGEKRTEDGVFPAEASVLDVAGGAEHAVDGEDGVELKRCGDEVETGSEEPDPEPSGGVGCGQGEGSQRDDDEGEVYGCG